MKNLFRTLMTAVLALCGFTAHGGPWLDRYWPLNDGDQKIFIYNGGLPMTMSVSDLGGGQFDISETYGSKGVTLQLQEDANHSFFLGVREGWVGVSFRPQVLLLDESILQNGGTVTTTTTAHQHIAYPATYTVTVRLAGAVTVPAGTFNDCRSITASETAVVPGYGTIHASALTAYLAPGVGIIKTVLSSGRWAQLVNGTVAGVPLGNNNYSQMTVQVSGNGAVTPNYNGYLLPNGRSYTMRARPKRGWVFQSWTDGAYNTIATTQKVTFVMQENLVLQANFVPAQRSEPAGESSGGADNAR